MVVHWLEQQATDVPDNDEWLSHAERARLNALHIPKRRADWRLGRWSVKLALASYNELGLEPSSLSRIEVHAAPSGAPQAFINGQRPELALSLSHSNGTALCVLAESSDALGCDIEAVENRSRAFIEDYFTADEQQLINRAGGYARNVLATLIWSAKESALKALGVGLREDTRSVQVAVDVESVLATRRPQWSSFIVQCSKGGPFQGAWRRTDSLLRTVVANSFPRLVQLRTAVSYSVQNEM